MTINKQHQQLLEQAYKAFNARDISSVLNLLDKDVDWPNGWEGGYVHGHDEVRDYWTRQWKELDPKVVPLSFTPVNGHQMEVEVRQTVNELSGKELFDGTVYHVYTFSGEKVKRMEIFSFSTIGRL